MSVHYRAEWGSGDAESQSVAAWEKPVPSKLIWERDCEGDRLRGRREERIERHSFPEALKKMGKKKSLHDSAIIPACLCLLSGDRPASR